MNMFYGLAVMAMRGRVSVEDFVDDDLADPALLCFMQRITVVEDPGIDAIGRQARHACRMTVTTASGAISKEVLDRRGSPENPVDDAAVTAKISAGAADCLDQRNADRVVRLVGALERQDSLAALTAILGQAGAP